VKSVKIQKQSIIV